MSTRDHLDEEAHERATNDGYLKAHAAREDLARRAESAMTESLDDRIARQRDEAARAARKRST